jgi:hypothetical protein
LLKNSEHKPRVEWRPINRVSSAVWPMSTRKGVATGKAAQRRRDWIIQGRWWVILVDVLSLRMLLILATLFVVASSLVVAIVGLNLWYLLLLPLFLFGVLLIVPRYLASQEPGKVLAPAFSAFTQDLSSEQDALLLETPVTPVPVDPPLVRVLETYDLRKTQIEHFLMIEEETGKHRLVECSDNALWGYVARSRPLDFPELPYSQIGARPFEEDEIPIEEKQKLDSSWG